MRFRSRKLFLGLGLMLVVTVPGRTIAAQSCALEYSRADNMWAGWGSPGGSLGAETITLEPGQKRVFVTDWAYEKKRNDGTNYYGSHLRYAVNRGEWRETVWGIAAPVRNGDGGVVAGIGISGPSTRMKPGILKDLAAEVVRAAAVVGQRLATA